MDNSVLKKRLSTFKSAKGTLRGVSDEVVMEVLRGWEAWPGATAEFYREIGLSKQQLAIMIKKGKKLVKSGVVTEGEFNQIPVEVASSIGSSGGFGAMVLRLSKDRVIEFSQVDQLVEFLNKAP